MCKRMKLVVVHVECKHLLCGAECQLKDKDTRTTSNQGSIWKQGNEEIAESTSGSFPATIVKCLCDILVQRIYYRSIWPGPWKMHRTFVAGISF